MCEKFWILPKIVTGKAVATCKKTLPPNAPVPCKRLQGEVSLITLHTTSLSKRRGQRQTRRGDIARTN